MPSADGWYMKHNPSELPVLTKGVEIIVGSNTMDSLNAPPYAGAIPTLPDFTPKSPSAFKTLATDYFGSSIFDVYPEPAAGSSENDTAKEFYRMQGDVCNQCPKHFAAQKFLAANETVFAYQFGYATEPFEGLACHACEVSDVFNLTISGSSQRAGSYDPHLGDTMSRYWASFVRSGLKSDLPHGNPVWPEYRASIGTAKSLDITTGSGGEPQVSIQGGLDSRRCEFFEKFMKASDGNMQKYIDFCNFPVPLSSMPVDSTVIV